MYDIQEGHMPMSTAMSDITRDEFKRILLEEHRHNKERLRIHIANCSKSIIVLNSQ